MSGRDRRRGRRRPGPGSAALGVVLTALALQGCAGGAGGRANSTPAPASLQQLTEAFLQYAQCARTHGMPGLPDPVVDRQGNDSYPALSRSGSPRWPASVLTGCASVWDHVHQIRARYDASHAVGARATNSLSPQQALAFSRCVRLHGFPTFPDPGPDGAVSQLPPGWSKPDLSATARAAVTACATGDHG